MLHLQSMKRIGWEWVLLTALLAVPPPGCGEYGKSGNNLVLAQDGKALVPIVIATDASERTQQVSKELAAYLKRITGATFEIKTGDGSAGIVLGKLKKFPDASLAKDLEIRNVYDGKEAYVIRTEAERLLLLGATDMGASHAAFRLLELIGCRWFFPAREWEVVPSIPTLNISINETDRPALLSRSIWYGDGFFFDDNGLDLQSREDYVAWCRHNRMSVGESGSLRPECAHAWQAIIADNKTAFAEHPEYLSLVSGKRQGVKLCVSNPEVRRIATEWVLKQFEANPSRDMVSLEPSDGVGQCECVKCLKLGSISDRVFGLANEVARAVTRAYPGKLVGMLAYSDHSVPPSFALEPNVYVQLTTSLLFGNRSFEDLLEAWPKVCRNVGVYDYFSVFMWNFDLLPGGMAGSTRYIEEKIPFFIAHRITSLNAESTNSWGPHGRGYYLASKLMWNPKLNGREIVDDFCTKAFGPASAVMSRFYERYDGANNPLICSHTLALGYRDLQEATRLAEGRSDVLARLDHLKQYMHYLYLRDRLTNETDAGRRKELTIELLKHTWRTRYSYMNHTQGMLVNLAAQAAKEFNEPSWAEWAGISPAGKRPWFTADLITREETAQSFQQGLAWFKTVDIEERKYSDDLVPVRLGETTPTESSVVFLGNSLRYVLYSIKGEAISMKLGAGNCVGWGPDCRYRLTDSFGKIIGNGAVPNDSKEHPIGIRVPKPGRYFLEMFPGHGAATAAMWRPSNQAWAITLDRYSTTAGTIRALYFYVPKGTRQIQFYYFDGNTGSVPKVCTQDGQVVKSIGGLTGDIYTIPVPAGEDGKTWSIGPLALGRLHFFNLPKCISVSPNTVMVPREVAAADNLLIAE